MKPKKQPWFKKTTASLALLLLLKMGLHAQSVLFSYSDFTQNGGHDTVASAKPLDVLALANIKGNLVKVIDGKGKEYAAIPVKKITTFTVAGALGNI